jgi:transcriptional antiterminator RfaH
MEAWYALHTKPHSEATACQALAVRNFNAYLPLLPPRKDRMAQPLFPTYMFVRCDLEAIGISSLEWIPGLRRILTLGGRPAIVPDEAIELIRAKMSQIEAQGGLPRHGFQPGDEVVIDKGPLSGMRGIFEGPVGPAERVRILIRFLGQANRAEVPVEALRAVEGKDPAAAHRRGTRGRGRQVNYHDEPARRNRTD